jgi:hypothetical protein
MIPATLTPATHLAAFLASAELVATTSLTAHDSVVVEEALERSFPGTPSWSPRGRYGRFLGEATSVSESATLQIAHDRLVNPVLAELASFRELQPGWDGEEAAKPSAAAINEAARFARIAGITENDLEPTLHVDGSVILEIAEDIGSLRFKGDGQIIYALSETGYGVVPFDGFTIPEVIWPALPV